MSETLPLKEMTIHEKLAAMEAVCEDDLARSPECIESPVWHEEALNEGRSEFQMQRLDFEDWETAK